MKTRSGKSRPIKSLLRDTVGKGKSSGRPTGRGGVGRGSK